MSKAVLNAYTLGLAAAEPTLAVNACTPGFIATDLTAGFASDSKKPPHEGTHAPFHLLFGALPAGAPSGRYYGSDCKRSPLDKYRGPGDPEYCPEGELPKAPAAEASA